MAEPGAFTYRALPTTYTKDWGARLSYRVKFVVLAVALQIVPDVNSGQALKLPQSGPRLWTRRGHHYVSSEKNYHAVR
jgi:hypothetical protein